MTRDDIIRMAREAGHPLDEAQSGIVLRFQAVLADFAQTAYAAGAAAQREKDAQVCESITWSDEAKFFAKAIRERSE
jgi:hypothetical protein